MGGYRMAIWEGTILVKIFAPSTELRKRIKICPRGNKYESKVVVKNNLPRQEFQCV